VINIREFLPNDIFSVIKIASETLPEHYNPSLFNYFYESFPKGFIVVEKFNKIIGFIVGTKTNQNTVRLLMLSISEKYRRQKLGSNLIKYFIREMIQLNIKHIELEVRVDNKQAINFYRKNGFKITEIIQKFYQNGEDAYRMKRVI
jgi:ribosomal protein S18 acetylase RimI-like enzyme